MLRRLFYGYYYTAAIAESVFKIVNVLKNELLEVHISLNP
jgi:hypothetical protein